MSDCPVCGHPLHVDEEWRLRPGRIKGLLVKENDYAHKTCADEEKNELHT